MSISTGSIFGRINLSILSLILYIPCVFANLPQVSDSPFYIKKTTWQESMLASQEILISSCSEKISKGASFVQASPWYRTKPIDDVVAEESWNHPQFDIRPSENGTAVKTLVKDSVDLAAKDKNDDPIWHQIPEFHDGELYPLKNNNYKTIYFYRSITVPSACMIKAIFYASGYFVTPQMQVWFNGQMIVDRSPEGDRYPYQEANLHLKTGVNHLLIRAHNLYMLSVDLWPKPGSVASIFWPSLFRDFPETKARRQMEWEMKDGIWSEPLASNQQSNCMKLTGRYADACPGTGYTHKIQQFISMNMAGSGLNKVRKFYYQAHEADGLWNRIKKINFNLLYATCSAVSELKIKNPDDYPQVRLDYPRQIEELKLQADQVRSAFETDQEDSIDLLKLETLLKKLEAIRWYALRSKLGVDEIIFITRMRTRGYNWYGDLSYFLQAPSVKMYCEGGSKLCRLNLRTGIQTVILEDPAGAFRDPNVHYDGNKILFAWRRGGTEYYHLYEMNLNGSSLRQITDGSYDDIEGIYLPDGDIIFSSTRCNRWIACGTYRTSILFRCDADGRNIRPLSSNVVSENTPWMLPDGRVIFMRWEYVDRNQLRYQHLWTINPDGTGIMTFFGNQFANNVFIDAKPIPGTDKVIYVELPNHGSEDRRGTLMILDPKRGPDDRKAAKPLDIGPRIKKAGQCMDPYPIAKDCFLFVCDRKIYMTDGRGNSELIYTLPQDAHPNLMTHEPRPIRSRKQEPVIPVRIDLSKATGRLALIDITHGRNMTGVKPGEIKKLLVLEQLPKPLNVHGGPQPVSMGGTFTLKRVLGTVPVETDGSAFMELPAMRSLFFVALDEKNFSVKRMQSFVTLQPGEFTSCSGCHENRTETPRRPVNILPSALARPASKITPIENIPDVFDYPRDIQPILDRHCIACHDYEPGAKGGPRSGGVILTGDHGPWFSHSYATLTLRRQFADGRNDRGNMPPYTIGASASPLMQKINGEHHGVILSSGEYEMIRYWIEVGGNYVGTYAALGGGWVTVAADSNIKNRCSLCHLADLQDKLNPELIYNLSRPEKSLVLLAPLAKKAGGYGLCTAETGKPVFFDKHDPDYLAIHLEIQDAIKKLNKLKRFDITEYRAIEAYFREMKGYGLLTKNFDPIKDTIDYYEMDQKYWRSLWHQPYLPNRSALTPKTGAILK